MGLQPPYLCKNAPFETIQELRLIYGMDMPTLIGEDANLNGILDPNENDGDALPPSDNQDSQLDPGLLEYLTAYSREPTITTNGFTRYNVTTFIVGVGGPALVKALTNNTTITVQRAQQIIGQGIESARTLNPFHSPLEFYMRGGMTLTRSPRRKQISGHQRPGVGEREHCQHRGFIVHTGFGFRGGRHTHGVPVVQHQHFERLDRMGDTGFAPDQCDSCGPLATGKTYRYTADIAAVGHNGRGYRRTRFVFDTSQGIPVIIYRQDLTQLGWALGKDARSQGLAAK